MYCCLPFSYAVKYGLVTIDYERNSVEIPLRSSLSDDENKDCLPFQILLFNSLGKKSKSFPCTFRIQIVTFKDLQKLVQSQSEPDQSQLLQRIRNKPFWIWGHQEYRQEYIKTKGDCCFNHIIGQDYQLRTAMICYCYHSREHCIIHFKTIDYDIESSSTIIKQKIM